MNEEEEYSYTGFENLETAQHLKDGEVCKVIGIGNSMTPILKSRQPVICEPVTEDTVLEKKDIVLCKDKTGQIFGGFTKVSWEKRDCKKNDPESFLFSLNKNMKYCPKNKGTEIKLCQIQTQCWNAQNQRCLPMTTILRQKSTRT